MFAHFELIEFPMEMKFIGIEYEKAAVYLQRSVRTNRQMGFSSLFWM